MDTNVIFIVAIFACIIIAAFLVFRQRGNITIKGPLGTQLDLDVSNEASAPTPAISAKNLKSQQGNVRATDETGRGVNIDGVEALHDIEIHTQSPNREIKKKIR